jgi:hypothetical protein
MVHICSTYPLWVRPACNVKEINVHTLTLIIGTIH